MFEELERVKSGELPRMNADVLHRHVLDEVLDNHDSLKLSVVERDELNQAWHRMKTWDGSVDAIHKLRETYTTIVLTVLSLSITVDCSKLNGLSWDGIMRGEFMEWYKKDPEAYQQGATLLCYQPSEVMMVATHAADLMGAKMPCLRRHTSTLKKSGSTSSQRPNLLHPLSEFDVSAHSWAELVEKLT
jgi:2-haloacid dehalogenase